MEAKGLLGVEITQNNVRVGRKQSGIEKFQLSENLTYKKMYCKILPDRPADNK